MNRLIPLLLALTLTTTAAAVARGERLVLVAGGGTGGEGGPAAKAEIMTPFGLAFDGAGSSFFVEFTGHRVRKIGADGVLSTLAGTGRKGDGGDGGPAAKAEFNGPHHLAVTRAGDLYVADTWNNRVRKIDGKTGLITPLAGTGRKGFSGDGGDATRAEFGGIYCLALDEPHQRLYLADLDNRRVRLVDLKSGVVKTVAGDGRKGVPKDGRLALSAPLVDPRAVATDGEGTVYVLERGGNALRVVDRTGHVFTIVGTGKAGDSGDGGPAIKAALNGPKHLCFGPNGGVTIADTENHRVRYYNPTDFTIRTVAGTGRPGSSGLDGPPGAAQLDQPHGVTIGPDGLLYICDSLNNRILKVARSGPATSKRRVLSFS